MNNDFITLYKANKTVLQSVIPLWIIILFSINYTTDACISIPEISFRCALEYQYIIKLYPAYCDHRHIYANKLDLSETLSKSVSNPDHSRLTFELQTDF